MLQGYNTTIFANCLQFPFDTIRKERNKKVIYTFENNLKTVPVIASFSKDGRVIPLYVQLDGESIRVSCRSSKTYMDYSVFQCDYMKESDSLIHAFEIVFLHDKLLWGFKKK